ncbi:MAG: PepSY domain-containing protein [Sphingomicrobium sp.]
MRKTSIIVAGVAAAASTGALASPHAKLSMALARAIALKAAPGKIVDSEYEKEAGAWRYSFDIRQGNRIHEIGVNANTGKIVENKFEGLKDND